MLYSHDQLYKRIIHIHLHTKSQRRHKNDDDTVLLEKYTSHFIERARKGYSRFYCERGLETEQNCNILTPTLLAITVFLSRSPGLLNRGPGSPLCCVLASSTTSCHQRVWSPKLTDFLSLPSYIIVQSTTQYLPITGHRNVSLLPSLEWHVWSSSSGNNCLAVHWSLSSGASMCDSTMGF